MRVGSMEWLRPLFLLIVCNGLIFSSIVHGLIIKQNPIRLRVLEYSSRSGSLQKVLNSRYSDLVVGEEVDKDSQIVLECSALAGPLRWVYSGDGVCTNSFHIPYPFTVCQFFNS